MNNIATESFINWCDEMKIANESTTKIVLPSVDGLIRKGDQNLYKILSEGYNVENIDILGTTAFGDFIILENQKYVKLISFSRNKVTVLESGLDYIQKDMNDKDFLNKYFNYELYKKAVKTLGRCKDTECYTVVPIPAIGGEMKLENLEIGALREYIAICIQFVGKLS